MKEFVPYLNFDGNCREAMKFPRQFLGIGRRRPAREISRLNCYPYTRT